MTEIVTCGEKTAECLCVKPIDHEKDDDDIHACDTGCGGSWTGTWSSNTFKPITFPTGFNTGLPR